MAKLVGLICGHNEAITIIYKRHFNHQTLINNINAALHHNRKKQSNDYKYLAFEPTIVVPTLGQTGHNKFWKNKQKLQKKQAGIINFLQQLFF